MMESNLPLGWELVKVEDIGEVITGGTPSKSNIAYYGNHVPFYKPTDLEAGFHTNEAHDNLSVDGAKKARLLPEKSILITCIGATIGKTGFIRKAGASNQQINSIIPHKPVVPEFIYYACVAPEFQKSIIQNASATTLPILNKSRFSKLTLPLPPLAEQQRIVAQLDALMGKVQSARERLEKIPSILKRFRQAVLAAAVSGRLTADWREQNPRVESVDVLLDKVKQHRQTLYLDYDLKTVNVVKTPDSWRTLNLENLCDPVRSITYGVIKLGEETPGGVPCLRTSDVKHLRIVTNDVKCISKSIADEYIRTYLFGGELLINVRGTLGGVALVPKSLAGYNISREVAMAPLLEVINGKWVEFFVGSVAAQNWLTKAAKGIAYTGINIADLKKLPVSMPPLAEQKEIVRRVEELFKLADSIEARYQTSKSYLDQLPQAILAKAFRGELVPQDPNDEPASMLLERIRAEKTGAGKKGKKTTNFQLTFENS